MDPNNGRLYPTMDAAHLAGVTDAVEIRGTAEAVTRISEAVRAQKKARRKAQKKSRKLNRG